MGHSGWVNGGRWLRGHEASLPFRLIAISVAHVEAFSRHNGVEVSRSQLVRAAIVHWLKHNGYDPSYSGLHLDVGYPCVQSASPPRKSPVIPSLCLGTALDGSPLEEADRDVADGTVEVRDESPALATMMANDQQVQEAMRQAFKASTYGHAK
jgi:hypothetical protein